MRTQTQRIEAVFTVVVLAVAAVLLGVSSPAHATTKGTENGFSAAGCYANWKAASVFDSNLTNSDVVNYDGKQFTNLMTDLGGANLNDTQGVNGWTNGGYLYEVSKALDPSATGWMELQHFYPGGPNPDGTITTAWRFPVGTDTAVYNATVVLQLPASATNITYVDQSAWFAKVGPNNPGSYWAAYNYVAPPSPPVIDPVDNTVTFNNVNLAAGQGLGIEIDATQPMADTQSTSNIGSLTFKGRLGGDSAACPPVSSGDTSTSPCTFNWNADGIQMVSGSGTGMSDLSRTKAVLPALGSRGKLAVDGWGGPSGNVGSFVTRFVYTTDDPVTDGTLVMHLDPRFQVDMSHIYINNPIPQALQYRVDNLYPNAITITDQQWDAATNTLTIKYNAPAWSGIAIEADSTVPIAEYTADAQFTSTINASGNFAVDPQNPNCSPAPALQLSKNVKDSAAPLGVVTEGEALTYQFVVTNTGNVPLADVKIVDARLGTQAIDCVPALAVGQTLVCSAPYTATAADVAGGQIQNTATAVGAVPLTGKTVTSNQDTATIPAQQNVTSTVVSTVPTTATETLTTVVPTTVTNTETTVVPTTINNTVTSMVPTTVTNTEVSTVPTTVTNTETVTNTATETATVTSTPNCCCTSVTQTSEVPVTMTVTSDVPTPTTLTETVTTEVPTTVTTTAPTTVVSSVPTTVVETTTAQPAPPTTVTATATATETATQTAISTVTTTRDVNVGAVTGTRSSDTVAPGSIDSGSLGSGSLDSGSLGGSSVPTATDGSSAGSVNSGSLSGSLDAGSLSGSLSGGASTGSSAGSLALGSLGLGVFGIGGLIWAIQNHLIVLPAGLMLPPLPGINWGSLIPAMPVAPTTQQTPPPAPGPQIDNGKG